MAALRACRRGALLLGSNLKTQQISWPQRAADPASVIPASLHVPSPQNLREQCCSAESHFSLRASQGELPKSHALFSPKDPLRSESLVSQVIESSTNALSQPRLCPPLAFGPRLHSTNATCPGLSLFPDPSFPRLASSGPGTQGPSSPRTPPVSPPPGVFSKGPGGSVRGSKVGRKRRPPVSGQPPAPLPMAAAFDYRLRRDNRAAIGYSVVLHHDLTDPPAAIPPAVAAQEAAEVEEGETFGTPIQAPAFARDAELLPDSAMLPRRKEVFAVVQVGSHQFKVTPGDVIYCEKLLFADVRQQVRLDRVLMLGSRHETVLGRPTVGRGAHVLAAVEEQLQAAKVIIFKKKRRKNYRRHRGHRQELTRLRILDVVETEEGREGSG